MKLSLPRNWSPSSRSSFRVKEREGAGGGVGGARHQARVEGPDLARARSAVGPGVEAEDLARGLVGQGRVPGEEEVGADRCRSCSASGVAIRPRSEAKRCSWKSSKGAWGRSAKSAVSWPVFGIGPDRADQLGVDPEARGDHEEAVLVAGLRFADVDGALEPPGQRRGADREGADLRVVGAVGPGPRSRSWPGLRCRRSARRRRRG